MSDENPPPFNWNLSPKGANEPAPEPPAEPPAPPAPEPPAPAAPEPPAPAAPEPLIEPPSNVGEPTEAYSFDEELTSPVGAFGGQAVGLPEPRDESSPATSPIEALFGETAFKEYDVGVFAIDPPTVGLAGSGTRTERIRNQQARGPRQPITPSQKVLLWVAGGLVAVLALVGIFFVGTRLSGVFAEPLPSGSPSPTATAHVAAQLPKVGPVPPGDYEWSALRGGECLQPFTNAWAEKYTVVDCTAAHAAQLVHRGIFADEAFAKFPGLDALLSRINLLCSAPTAIDYAKASEFTDVQISASYPATAEAWDAGQRDYFCFVSRSTNSPLTGSVAVAPPAAAIIQGVPGNDP